jgi:hypothetical protein
VLTSQGEAEFQLLLRQSWWRIEQTAEPLIPALSMMPFMSRDELLGALQSRVDQLGGQLKGLAFTRATIQDGATGAEGGIPEHVREIIDFMTARARSEREWTRTLVRRLREGAYTFAGEGKVPLLGPGQGWRGALDSAE